MATESGAGSSAPPKSLEDSDRHDAKRICLEKKILIEDEVSKEHDGYSTEEVDEDSDGYGEPDWSLVDNDDDHKSVEYSSDDDEVDPIEYSKYLKIVTESEGYDIGDCKCCKSWMINKLSKEGQEELKDYVVEALKGYNEDKGKQFVFTRIVKANFTLFKYWITFEVTDPTIVGDEPRTFQTRIKFPIKGGIDVQQIRPKPDLDGV